MGLEVQVIVVVVRVSKVENTTSCAIVFPEAYGSPAPDMPLLRRVLVKLRSLTCRSASALSDRGM